MKKLFVLSLMLATAVGIAASVNAWSTRMDVPAAPAIGATIVDFSLPGTDGKEHSLSSLKGKNGTVVIFIGVKCPVSNGYNERMEKIAQDYKDRGINVVGINANSSESGDAVKAHAAAHSLTFMILKDNGNKIADALGAGKTPEAYLLNAGNKLVYHGRIDNSRDLAEVNSSELRDALDATLSGKPVAKPTAAAFGCSINRAD
jgi:peroxiredoxin